MVCSTYTSILTLLMALLGQTATTTPEASCAVRIGEDFPEERCEPSLDSGRSSILLQADLRQKDNVAQADSRPKKTHRKDVSLLSPDDPRSVQSEIDALTLSLPSDEFVHSNRVRQDSAFVQRAVTQEVKPKKVAQAPAVKATKVNAKQESKQSFKRPRIDLESNFALWKQSALQAKEAARKLDQAMAYEAQKVEESMVVQKNILQQRMRQIEAAQEKSSRELERLAGTYKEFQESHKRIRNARVSPQQVRSRPSLRVDSQPPLQNSNAARGVNRAADVAEQLATLKRQYNQWREREAAQNANNQDYYESNVAAQTNLGSAPLGSNQNANVAMGGGPMFDDQLEGAVAENDAYAATRGAMSNGAYSRGRDIWDGEDHTRQDSYNTEDITNSNENVDTAETNADNDANNNEDNGETSKKNKAKNQ